MAHRPHVSVVDPRALTRQARDGLIDELYLAHSKIFAGVSRAAFAAYVVDSSADRTRIEVYRYGGEVVGYFAVHTFVRTIGGERWVVIRAEKGKLPRFRRCAKGSLLIAEVLRACVLHPRASKAFLGCFVHPSAYLALGHVAPEMYPHWERPTPPRIRRVMDSLGEAFGLAVVDPRRPEVRRVGWVTRDTASDRASWARRRDPMTRHFLRTNPGYREGQGLLILAPIRLRHFVEGVVRHAHRVVRRALRRSSGSPGAVSSGPPPPTSVPARGR